MMESVVFSRSHHKLIDNEGVVMVTLIRYSS